MYKKYSELRDKAGFNDLAVARATGIPQSTIYDWKQRSEKDESAQISVNHLAKIAKLFKVKIEVFL